MKNIVTLLCLLLVLCTNAQEYSEGLEQTNFFIPSAPAFAMLGVTPELVTRPGYIRDFKVDWRIKNYKVAPDLALEAHPVWFLYYDRHDLDTYRKSSPFMKSFSTTSLSFSTAKIDGVNHMSFAAKMNVYREKDPMTDNKLIKELQREVDWDEFEIHQKINDLRNAADLAEDKEQRRALRDSISGLKNELKMVREGQRERLKTIQSEYVDENWNASMLDVAFGRVWTYNNKGLDSLKIQKAGFALWANGSLRMGKKGLVTGILKYTRSGNDGSMTLSGSYRYGSPKYNFYFEAVYDRLPDLENAVVSDEEYFSNSIEYDLGSGWFHYDDAEMRSYFTMAYGGDFLLSRNILLNFALRTKMTSDLKFTQLIPVANLTCLMR